jgi:hypothetical protein
VDRVNGARLVGVLVAASFVLSAALLGLGRAGRALLNRKDRPT